MKIRKAPAIKAPQAIIASIGIGQFTNQKKDKVLSFEVREHHGMEVGSGDFVKNLFDPATLKKCRSLATKLRNLHSSKTIPCGRASGILIWARKESFELEFAALRTELMDFVNGLDWDALLARARQIHKATFNQAMYPNFEQFKERFYVDLNFAPIATTANLCPELQAVYGDRLTRDSKRKVGAAVHAALVEPITHLVEKLSDTSKPIFRDSILTNIQEIVGSIPDELQTGPVKKLAKAISGLKAKDLRSDDHKKNQVLADVRDLIVRFAASGIRDLDLD